MNTAKLYEQLDRVEYLLSHGLWDNEKHRMELRQQHVTLLDILAEVESPSRYYTS